jgi:hypothetical protein
MRLHRTAVFRPHTLTRMALAASLVLLATTAWSAGDVAFVTGETSAVSAKGESRALKQGDRVEPGETLVTGRRGEIHLIMDDRALLALRPNTRLVIDDYIARGTGEDRARLNLVAGFLRSVTGWIGNIAPANYRVRTATATIGIRGTDHEVGVVGEGPDAGTYDKVNDGATRLTNPAGEVEIAAGRAAFVAQDRPAPPRLLERIPTIFKPTENEGRIDASKKALAEDMERRLRARRTEGGESDRDCGPEGAAMRALRDFIQAYESGDLAGLQSRLNPAMPGYQRFVDQLAREFSTQKQIRIFVKDVQIQCGPDLANLVLTWEKRFLDVATFQPGLFSGQVSILMQRGRAGWQPGAFAGDSPFARASGSAARFTFGPAFSLATVTPQGVQVPVTLEVQDADLVGQGTITIQIVASNGDSENVTLSETAPGRFLRSTLRVSAQPPTPGNGSLEVAAGITLSARYIDQQPGNHQPPASLIRKLVPTGQLPVLQDTTPDSFAFPPMSQVTAGSMVTSMAQTITGINAPATVSVTGGLVSIQGGPFATAGSISNGQSVQARVTASATAGATVTAVVNIGGVTAPFTVTTATLAPDTVPDPFNFAAAFGAVPSSLVTSSPVVISGINAPTMVTVSGGEISIAGSGFSSSGGMISNGQSLQARGVASSVPGGISAVQVLVGGVAGVFQITSQAAGPDTTPDAFTFTPVVNATPSTFVTSNTISITGIDSPTPVSSATALVSVNGGTFASNGTISNGQTVSVRGLAPAGLGQTTLHQVNIGGVIGTFSISTVPADTTPDAFSFVPQTQAAPATPITSNTVTITGINVATPISIAGGTYSIAGGAFTGAPGTIANGQTLALRGVSSATTDGSGILLVMVTVGTATSTFSITTRDTTPDPIVFPTSFLLNSVCLTGPPVNSPSVPISGIDSPSPVTISTPASYSVAGGAFVTAGGTILNGQTLQLRRAVPAPNTSATVTVVVGQNGPNPGTTATWTITCQ